MFMAMYMFHIAFGIGLIALVMGLAMCKCCCHKMACETSANPGMNQPVKCCKCGKWMGVVIAILALISLICTVCAGYKQMNSGMMDLSAEQIHKMRDDMRKDIDMDNNANNNNPANQRNNRE